MIPITDYFDILKGLLKVRYFKTLKSIPAPRVIAYSVTWRCNAACDMCGVKNVEETLKDKREELGAEDIKMIFKDPLLRKLDLIRFTGGEPFLKEDFIDIVDEIIKNTRTKIYYITTNGFYSERIFSFIKRLAPKTRNLIIQISLDAPYEVHDNIRKVPGLYRNAITTLYGLKDLKNEYAFSYGINQTLTCQTIRHLDEMSKLCQDLECDHKVYLAQEVHESDILEGARLNSRLALISSPGRDEAEVLYDKIEKHYRKFNNIKNALFSAEFLWKAVERYVLLGSKNRLLQNCAFPNPRCLAMFFYLRILPNGAVMPCTLKPRIIGNLKKQTFTEIWNSKNAYSMRREVQGCKGCWVECDIVPNIVYSFDMVKEIYKEWLGLLKDGIEVKKD